MWISISNDDRIPFLYLCLDRNGKCSSTYLLSICKHVLEIKIHNDNVCPTNSEILSKSHTSVIDL